MSPRRYRITVKGRSYDVEVGDLSQSTISVSVDGVAYEVSLPAEASAKTSPTAAPPSRQTPPARPASRPAAPPRPAIPAGGGGNEVRAMMPGRVLTVSVKPGDSVSAGQALLVIESMKMENTVASPRDGRVSAVHVGEGDAVQHGQTLVELE